MNWKLISQVIALNVANGVAFCDLLGIAAVMPTVTVHFSTIGTIGWSATSQLIGATVGQCILGYLSDVWSRRAMLIFALLLLLCSSIVTAIIFQTDIPILFVVFRALSGIAVGSISNLVNIAQSDIATREQRLKLQGVQGLSVGAGSILGMMVGAACAERNQVHQLYWVEAGLASFALICVAWMVKPHRTKPTKQELRGVMMQMDYAGIFSGIGFIVPGLILMANFTKLSMPEKAVLGPITATCLSAFLYVGFKRPFNCRPIVPFRFFKNRTLSAIYIQNLLFGAAYYTFIYFLPVYLMVVRQYDPVKASAMMTGYFVCHGIWSTISGKIILWLQRNGHKSYSPILLQGFLVWAVCVSIIAAGVSAITRISDPVVVTMASFIGAGTGAVFQNSVMAIREHVSAEDNAVALGTRNVLRYLGGATGTAISSMIMRSVLNKEIPSNPVLEKFKVHTINPKELRALPNAEDRRVVMDGFGKGVKWVFTASAGLLVVCIVLCALIQEAPKKKEEDEEEAALKERTASTSASSVEETPAGTDGSPTA